jgi:DNA-binding MarR family transcriptional regulator
MNSQEQDSIKDHEYKLMDAIAQDSTITQSGLSTLLGMAVGSVNWYIKRLINRGYVKVSHLDRTRLKYDLTPEGMTVLTQRALQYMQSSLQVYRELRQTARKKVEELKAQGVTHVYLDGENEAMDILRLTCIEAGMAIDGQPDGWVFQREGRSYRLVEPQAKP